MSESFRSAIGRRVVSRASAEELGSVAHLVATVDCRGVAAIVIGRGKKAQLVDWDQLSGFGADAVMVMDESALRPAGDDREVQAVSGKLDLLGARALSELGNELGVIDDIAFDPSSGALETLTVGGSPIPATAVLGAGSYAVVVSAGNDPTGQ